MTEEITLMELDEEDSLRIVQDILQRKRLVLEAIEQIKNEIRENDEVLEQMEDLDSDKGNSKNILLGKKKFNSDPRKGISWMIEENVIQNNPKSIAEFFYKNNEKGLSKTAIGEYLGDNREFNIQVLKEFVVNHDLTNKKLDEALRLFLWSFRLPGEAQKIDRMMEAFASWYVECNPGIFSCSDTCYVLSFSTIMLNTSLHNRSVSVKDKPSKEGFIMMNRGIDKDKNLPTPMLTEIYDSIKKQEFKVPDQDFDPCSQFYNPDKEGWLVKQGGSRYRNWKRRWFILEDKVLFYFEYTSDKEPKGIIPLANLQVREVTDSKRQNCFEIFLPQEAVADTIKIAKYDTEGKVFDATKHTSYRFSAPTPEEKDQWISHLRKSISNDPYYDMIAARKRSVEERQKYS